MAITRKPNISPPNPNPNCTLPPQSNPSNDLPAAAAASAGIETVSDYEKTREQRIKENRERLEKLGIVDLSNQLKYVSANNTPRRTPKYERGTPLKSPSLGPPEPRRRSSRLQDAPPVMYTEPKEPKLRKTRDVVLEIGSRPEYYTEEHDKLLGSTEMPWTLFVDGYVNGTRVYDPVTGKTCHQCRQKTLGQRTRCSNCTLVQGQFCGDCLYMRYGEHVVEANQNPNWICPPCRGICNCSLCRLAKGWLPTGAVSKKVRNLGYRSVAHYLIETKREPPAEETVSETQQSAKRALPFEGMDVSTDGLDVKAPDNTESEHEPTPENADASEESVMNAVVAEDVHAPNKKSSEVITKGSGNADVAEHEPNPENAYVGEESTMKADVSDQKRSEVSGRGRPRKRATTEKVAVAESTLTTENADVTDQKRSEVSGKGRPRRRATSENVSVAEGTLSPENAGDVAEHEPNPENADVDEESTMKADVTDQKQSEVSGRGRGRPRKRAKTETAAVVEGGLTPEHASSDDVANPENADVDEESTMKADVTDQKQSEVSGRGRGRPRKSAKTETAAVVEGALTPENASSDDVANHKPNPEIADVAKDAGAPDKKIPEVIKRGRPRTRSVVGKADVAEGASVPKNTSAGDVAKHDPIPENVDAAVIKKGRGRPRKNSMTGNTAMVEDSAMPESISVY